ncbi:MAG: hypothetical protein GY810_09855 [Aureispira sp.]|nr:hypothetical protein [Aureispira sp.]
MDPKELKEKLKQCRRLIKLLELYKEKKEETNKKDVLSDKYINSLIVLTKKAAQQTQIEIVGEKDNHTIFTNDKGLSQLRSYCKRILENKAAIKLDNTTSKISEFYLPARILADTTNVNVAAGIQTAMASADLNIFGMSKDAVIKAFDALKSKGGTHKEVVTVLKDAIDQPLSNISEKLEKALNSTENLAAVRKRIKFPLVQNFFKNSGKYKNDDFAVPNYTAIKETIDEKYKFYQTEYEGFSLWKKQVLLMLDDLTSLVDSHYHYKFVAGNVVLPSFLNIQFNDYTYDTRFDLGKNLFGNNVVKYVKTTIEDLDFFALSAEDKLSEVVNSTITKKNFESAITDEVSKEAFNRFNLEFADWKKAASKALNDDIEVLITNYHSCDFDGPTFKVELVNELDDPAMSALIPVLPVFKYERKKANHEEFRATWATPWENMINGIEASNILKQATEIVPFLAEEKWKGFLPSAQAINTVIGKIRSQYGTTTDAVQDGVIARNSQNIAKNAAKLNELEELQKEQAKKVEKLERLSGYNAIFQKITSQLADLVDYKFQIESKLNKTTLYYVDAKKRADINLNILRQIANVEVAEDENAKFWYDLIFTGLLTVVGGAFIGKIIEGYATKVLEKVLKSGKIMKAFETCVKFFPDDENAAALLASATEEFKKQIATPVAIIKGYTGAIAKSGMTSAINYASAPLRQPSGSIKDFQNLKLADTDNFEMYSKMLSPFLGKLLAASTVLRACYDLMEDVQNYENNAIKAGGDKANEYLNEVRDLVTKMGELIPAIDSKFKDIEKSINDLTVDASTTYKLEYNLYIDTLKSITYNKEVVERIFKDEKAKDFFGAMQSAAQKANGHFPKGDFFTNLLKGDFSSIEEGYKKGESSKAKDLDKAKDLKEENTIWQAPPRTIAIVAAQMKDKTLKGKGEFMQNLISLIDNGMKVSDTQSFISELKKSSLANTKTVAEHIETLINPDAKVVKVVDDNIKKKAEAILLLCKKDLLDNSDSSFNDEGVNKFVNSIELSDKFNSIGGGMQYYTAFTELQNLNKIPL